MVDSLAHPRDGSRKILEYNAEFYYYLRSTEFILKMFTLYQSDQHSNTTSAKYESVAKLLHFLSSVKIKIMLPISCDWKK